MRYNLSCTECMHMKLSNWDLTVNVTPNNSGIYEVICSNGHNFKIDILSHHFQVLFENAIHALSDKYYIESFSSFASSYERFMEYFIKIVYLSNGIKKEEFEKAWKLMSSRSERQIGAFIITFLKEFGELPTMMSNKMIELRNNVIHKGYFPTENDCIKFGDSVLEFIRPILKILKNDKLYEFELISSVNEYGYYGNDTVQQHYYPYQIFAINRTIDKTDEKDITDFLKDQLKI